MKIRVIVNHYCLRISIKTTRDSMERLKVKKLGEFCPDNSEDAKVEAFLKQHGFNNIHGDRDRPTMRSFGSFESLLRMTGTGKLGGLKGILAKKKVLLLLLLLLLGTSKNFSWCFKSCWRSWQCQKIFWNFEWNSWRHQRKTLPETSFPAIQSPWKLGESFGFDEVPRIFLD